jgi:hypothetical protein
MLNTRWIRLLVLLMISVVALLSVSPGPAAARTALSIDDLSCYYNGNATLSCYATVSGGTGSYTATWRPMTRTTSTGWNSPTQPYLTGPCAPERLTTAINLTVSDSSGASVFDGSTVNCGNL